MSQIKFGTDGWRAVIAEDFTFANVDTVAQATADFWNANPVPGTEKLAVVGYDRRFLSDAFGKQTAEVLAGNGFRVILDPGPAPTPSISFAVKANKGIGGVVITASHNPAIFNGFKLKSHFGGSAESSTCQAVEKFLGKSPVRAMPLSDAIREKKAIIRDLRKPHFAAIRKLVDFELIARSGLRFAHEALFGVGAGCFEQILAGTSCKVTTLNGAHDPFFGGINPEPIQKNYVKSAAYLKKHPHDLCLVTDGDADRIGGMDGSGRYLSTNEIICLLLRHFLKNRKSHGRVVKALTTTSMVDKICAAYGLPLTEVAVGFKNIGTEMIKGDVMLGAEESGSIGFENHIPERDGIAAGLMLLEMLAMERRPLRSLLGELVKEFGPHHYDRRDIHYPLEKRPVLVRHLAENPPAKLLGRPVADVQSYDGVKFTSDDTSWLMLRGSGTEPILRIYAEGRTPQDAQKLLDFGIALTKTV